VATPIDQNENCLVHLKGQFLLKKNDENIIKIDPLNTCSKHVTLEQTDKKYM